MIIGIGVDVVDIARFGRSLQRTPPLLERLFAPSERGLTLSSLAARFAAKEALIKAAGGSTGFTWQEIVVHSDEDRRPTLVTAGAASARLESMGVTAAHLSLSHDAGIASAFVVLEG